MALGLSLTRARLWCAAAALGCSAGAAQELNVVAPSASAVAKPEEPDSPRLPSDGAQGWPERSELFIAKKSGAQLTLRAFGAAGLTPFAHVLANDIRATLYDAELELLWFGDADARLWVIDLRDLGPGSPAPVLIASHLPQHAKLSVARAGRYVEGAGQVGEEWMELVLHWEQEPWIDGGEGEGRLDSLDGHAWLERERRRSSREVPAPTPFEAEGPHVALPPSIAQCDDARLCGAALPFGALTWQLVVAKNDETHGDFSHNGCLLYDPEKNAFARPPEASEWAKVVDTQLSTCGPYRFNAKGDAFLVSDKVCRLGGGCASLESFGSGWLAPGATVGIE
jgi:hypothetical protein